MSNEKNLVNEILNNTQVVESNPILNNIDPDIVRKLTNIESIVNTIQVRHLNDDVIGNLTDYILNHCTLFHINKCLQNDSSLSSIKFCLTQCCVQNSHLCNTLKCYVNTHELYSQTITTQLLDLLETQIELLSNVIETL